jgi:hypothetical protein
MSIIVTSNSSVGEPVGVDVAPKGMWSGYNGNLGFYRFFPATTDKGYMEWQAANNVGNFSIQMVNEAFAQASVITLPDPSSATANFVLDVGIVAAGVGANSPGSLTGVTHALQITRGGVNYYLPLYSVNT